MSDNSAMTDSELGVVWHALGLEGSNAKKKPWRNHFAAARDTDDYRTCEALAKKGDMRRGADLGYGHYFHVTEQGTTRALAAVRNGKEPK